MSHRHRSALCSFGKKIRNASRFSSPLKYRLNLACQTGFPTWICKHPLGPAEVYPAAQPTLPPRAPTVSFCRPKIRDLDGAQSKVALRPHSKVHQAAATQDSRRDAQRRFDTGHARIVGAPLLEQGPEPSHDLLRSKHPRRFRRHGTAGKTFDQRADHLLIEPMRGLPAYVSRVAAFDRADGRCVKAPQTLLAARCGRHFCVPIGRRTRRRPTRDHIARDHASRPEWSPIGSRRKSACVRANRGQKP